MMKIADLFTGVKAWITGAVIAAVLAAGGGLYWKGHHDASQAAKPKIELAVDQAGVSSLNASGARQAADQLQIYVHQRDDMATIAAQAQIAANKAEDANAPLNPDRAARLLADDRRLCDARPGLVGCRPPN